MALKTNPCYKCSNREVGCHAKCEKYISWIKEREESIKDYRQHLSDTNLLYGYITANKTRNLKKKHVEK